jgi:hypothetical protein
LIARKRETKILDWWKRRREKEKKKVGKEKNKVRKRILIPKNL